MNPKTKKILKCCFIILLMVAFLSLNVVYAATKSKISFCDYAGTRRTLKIIGMMINIAKVVVPLIIIFVIDIICVNMINSGTTTFAILIIIPIIFNVLLVPA